MRCIAVTQTDSTPDPIPFSLVDGWVLFRGGLSGAISADSGGGSITTVFDPADDTRLPRICNKFSGTIRKTFAGLTGVNWAVVGTWTKNVEDTVDHHLRDDNQIVENGQMYFHVEVPVRTQYPYGSSGDSRGKFSHQVDPGAGSVSATDFQLNGLRLTI
jgi:hypothetical protein